MEAARSSETLMFYRDTTQCHNPEVLELNLHRGIDLKYHISRLIFYKLHNFPYFIIYFLLSFIFVDLEVNADKLSMWLCLVTRM